MVNIKPIGGHFDCFQFGATNKATMITTKRSKFL